jgi:arylsulfatase A
MGDLRGLKRDLWEGGHRVPLIVRYPGVVPQGIVNNQLICQTDILATVAGLAGIKLPDNAGEDSFDQSPGFKNGDKGVTARNHLVIHTINGSYAIRYKNWMLIEAKSGEVSKEPGWIKQKKNLQPESTEMILYDLEKDPGETTNIYNAYPAKVAELKSLLDGIRKKKNSRFMMMNI